MRIKLVASVVLLLSFAAGYVSNTIVHAQLTYSDRGPSVFADADGNTLLGNTNAVTFLRTSGTPPSSSADKSCWIEMTGAIPRILSLKCNDAGTVRTLAEVAY